MLYNSSSPYYKTAITASGYLDVMTPRSFPALDSDVVVTINRTYHRRPDLLAYDLYSDSRLWWVFAQRNPNTLINPLLDFSEGTQIWVPNIDTLKAHLGI